MAKKVLNKKEIQDESLSGNKSILPNQENTLSQVPTSKKIQKSKANATQLHDTTVPIPVNTLQDNKQNTQKKGKKTSPAAKKTQERKTDISEKSDIGNDIKTSRQSQKSTKAVTTASQNNIARESTEELNTKQKQQQNSSNNNTENNVAGKKSKRRNNTLTTTVSKKQTQNTVANSEETQKSIQIIDKDNRSEKRIDKKHSSRSKARKSTESVISNNIEKKSQDYELKLSLNDTIHDHKELNPREIKSKNENSSHKPAVASPKKIIIEKQETTKTEENRQLIAGENPAISNRNLTERGDNGEQKRKKKKRNKKDTKLRRDDTQSDAASVNNETGHLPSNNKYPQKEAVVKVGNTKFVHKNENKLLLRGGKHAVAPLENPERKKIILQLPLKKQAKNLLPKEPSNIDSIVKEVPQQINEDKIDNVLTKQNNKFSKKSDKKHEIKPFLDEVTEVKPSNELNEKEQKEQPKNKRDNKTQKDIQTSKHKKQQLDKQPSIIEETTIDHTVDIIVDAATEVPVSSNERKQQHSKPYNIIPLPKAELTKKRQSIRHKIPLPLKVGLYNDIAESMIAKVEHFLSVELCISPGSSLLLAVSGGVDSIVMADIFCAIAHRLHYDVQLCHINHKLRGKESDDDERSVKGFAKRCGLRIHAAHVHVEEYSKKNKISIETAARILRYNALDKQARSCGAEYVVTAHTADDAAETFLMNLFRGSGITGLTGIPIERPLSKKVNVIRPMISLRKDEIISYAQARGLFWREDSSNSSLLFTRNKIRLKLLPQLRELFGISVVETINRTSLLMQGVDEVMENILSVFLPRYVHQIETGAYSVSLIGLSTQSEFVKGEIFQSILVQKLNQQNQSLSTIKRITQLVTAETNTCVDVNGQIVAIRERDSIILSKRKKHFDYYNTITLNGELIEQEWILRLSVLHKKPKEWSNNPFVEYFDADLLPKLLQVRSWRDGDKFQPIGMKGHTTVSDFLTNTKTRAFERKKVLVLCAGSEIVWIIGKRISDCFKVTESTQVIIKAEFIQRSASENDEKDKK